MLLMSLSLSHDGLSCIKIGDEKIEATQVTDKK